MACFGDRVKKEMESQGKTQADLCRLTGLKAGHISPYFSQPDRDPRLSTAAKLAEALGVSLDYLAGRTDNPAGMCEEEAEGLRIDAEARAMLRGFTLLPPDGRASVMEQVELQQLKSSKGEVQDYRVSGAA